MTDNGREFWDRAAERYDASMRLWGGPIPRAIELTAESVTGADRVLEVAAGTGLFTEALARRAGSLIATDYSAAMVDALRRRVTDPRVECRQADVYALDFEPGSFDVIVAANVLHLLPDLPRALAVFAGLLKPGGRVVVPTYCHDENLRAKIVSRLLALTGFPGQRRFTLASLCQALIDAGFRPSRTELIPGLMPIGFVAAIKPPP